MQFFSSNFSSSPLISVNSTAACGMYYLAELIEEFTITTKRVLGYLIKAELALHLLLLLDKAPFHCLALGITSNVFYARMLKKFPYMRLASTDGLAAIASFLGSTAAWCWYYWKSYYTVEYALAFMLVTTWLIPFGFFLSFAGDQSVLPGAGGYPYSAAASGSSTPTRDYNYLNNGGPGGGGGGGTNKQRRGLALRIFDVLRRKRDQVLPEMTKNLPPSLGLYPKEKI